MIVVTGGAGFIGSHVVEALVESGRRVRVVDDFSTGHRKNLARVRERVDVINGCITDETLLREAFTNATAVIHQAACASVVRSLEQARPVHEVNATGTLQVLETARECKVKRVVLASSSAVYGENDGAPARESDLPKPASPYAAQKLLGEHYARIYASTHGLHTVLLRYYNVFGPRQDPGSPYSGVISIFARRLLSNETAVIYGDGEQTRDFVDVADVIRANLLATFADVPPGAVFNVATGKSITIRKLFDTMASLAGRTSEPRLEPSRAGEIRHSRANVDAARESLGFTAESSLEEGLNKTLAWAKTQFRQHATEPEKDRL